MSDRPIRCGNDPRARLALGDQQVVAEFEALLAARQQWPRGFRLIPADGSRCYHGVEFPSGRVILDHVQEGLIAAWLSMDLLLATPGMEGATVERPEETE